MPDTPRAAAPSAARPAGVPDTGPRHGSATAPPPNPASPTTATGPGAAAGAAVAGALALFMLSLAGMVSGIALRVSDPLLPRLAAEFSVTLGQASHVVTFFAVAYGVAQLFYGPLGDRYGKYRVVGWACAASALASLACALAPGHATLVIARMLAGCAAAGVIPLSMAWIGDHVPYERRQPVLARFLIGQISGFAIGVTAGGYAAEHLDWRVPFFGLAVLFFAAALLLRWVRRRERVPAAPLPGTGPAARRARPSMRVEFGAVLARPWARVVLLTVFLEGACVFGPFAFVASHLHLQSGLPLSVAGATLMMLAFGGLSFALGARVLVSRLGETRLVRWGAVLAAVSLLTVAFAGVWWTAAPACAALGLGFYMFHNTLQTHGTQMAPERRGAGVAAFAACFFLGQSVGVGIAGLLVGPLGTAWVITGGAVGVLGVARYFNARRKTLLAPVATPA